MARPSIIFVLSVLIAIGFAQGRSKGHGNSNVNMNSNRMTRRSTSNMNINKNINVSSRRGLGKFPTDKEDKDKDKDAEDFDKLGSNYQGSKKSRGGHRQLMQKGGSDDIEELIRTLTAEFTEKFGNEAADAFTKAVKTLREAINQAKPPTRRSFNVNQNQNINSFGGRPNMPAEPHEAMRQAAQVLNPPNSPPVEGDAVTEVPTSSTNLADLLGMLVRDGLGTVNDFGEGNDSDEDDESSESQESTNFNQNINQNVNQFGVDAGPPLPLPPLFPSQSQPQPRPQSQDIEAYDNVEDDHVLVDVADDSNADEDDDIDIETSEDTQEPEITNDYEAEPPALFRALGMAKGKRLRKKKRRSGVPQQPGNYNMNSNINTNQFRRSLSNLRAADTDNNEYSDPESNVVSDLPKRSKNRPNSQDFNSNLNVNAFRRTMNKSANSKSKGYASSRYRG